MDNIVKSLRHYHFRVNVARRCQYKTFIYMRYGPPFRHFAPMPERVATIRRGPTKFSWWRRQENAE